MEQNEQRKILMIEMVEDEHSLRKVLREKLELEGFEVVEARDGKEGLAIASHEHPDLILLDIMMPGMDGFGMMRELRSKNEWGKQVPVILLTNLSPDDDSRMKAITEFEPAYYLVKAETTVQDLLEKIKIRLGTA